MRALLSFRFFVPMVLGIALGVFLADAVWWHKDNGVRTWVESIPILYKVIACLHLPAMLLFYGCVYLRLGPSGEAGWVVLPCCIIAQWVIIGVAVGFWLARRKVRKIGSA
ncbi:MAG: hypothetical protein ABSG04_05525 [Verrucomicrobiota bacterium]|jgi:uncharacterized protein YneF (UPF0154 family)